MKRIVIVGACGSGKTSLGRHLAENLDYPLIDLDDLYWLPNWIMRPKDEILASIKKTVEAPQWVICGNHSPARKVIWSKADTIIWIDPPFLSLLWRVLKRSIRLMVTKQPICNGNYETLRRLFCKDSILYYLVTSYHKCKRRFPEARHAFPQAKWIHVKGRQFLEPHRILQK